MFLLYDVPKQYIHSQLTILLTYELIQISAESSSIVLLNYFHQFVDIHTTGPTTDPGNKVEGKKEKANIFFKQSCLLWVNSHKQFQLLTKGTTKVEKMDKLRQKFDA